MKKIFKILIALIIISLITFICYEVYEYFTKEEPEVQTKNEVINEVINEAISNEPIFTLDNYPKVDASLATQPLTDAFIKNFTGETEISEEYLDYTNTHPGYI